jgi:hypothetical protein
MPIYTYLDVSTAHITTKDLQYLDDRWGSAAAYGNKQFYIPQITPDIAAELGDLAISATETGYIVNIPIDNSDPIIVKQFLAMLRHDGYLSDHFVNIIGYAIESGAYMVCFDGDAVEEPGLFETPEE